MTIDLVTHWNDVVAAALLGTDRRDAPRPVGPLADLAVESGVAAGPSLLVQQAAALTVGTRCGLTPRPAATSPAPPDHDPRPPTPPACSVTWLEIVDEWPLLEAEWLTAVVASGRRLSPELVAPLLDRHRASRAMHERVVAASGPIAPWLIEWSSRFACATRASAPSSAEVVLTPELRSLLDLAPEAAMTALGSMARDGSLGAAHRGVLTNLVLRLPHATLRPAAAACAQVADDGILPGLWYPMSRLASLRHRMIDELATEREHDR